MIVLLTVEGETITTTPNHPFYTADSEWVQAGSLELGEQVYSATGEAGIVRDVEFIYTPQPTYNLTVAEAHTYFVGEGQWLVHNNLLCTFMEGFTLAEQGTIQSIAGEFSRRTGIDIGALTFWRAGNSKYGEAYAAVADGAGNVAFFDDFFTLSRKEQLAIFAEEYIHTLQGISSASPGVAAEAERQAAIVVQLLESMWK